MAPKRKRSLADIDSISILSANKIIVGVDYGTTYTGASYISSKGKDLGDISLIETWPGPSRDTEAVSKVVSRIAYPTDNPDITTQCWGYEIRPGMTSYSWTKLLLDQNTPLQNYDDPMLEEASNGGILKVPKDKAAVDVVADYLSEIYKYLLGRLAKHITEDALRVTPLEFWFTVPAIWSDQAQDATITAAKQAGFGPSTRRPNDQIFLISEPEAAAITALKKYSSADMGGCVKPGDGVLICDCGGGTVDITTYLVVRTTPRLSFEDLCTGTGGKCGSTAVDRNFYRLMSQRFGRAFDNLPMKRKSPGSEFMSRFEIVKRDFWHPNGLAKFEYMSAPNADPKYFDEEERLVIISREDLVSIFDPAVDQILGLVRRQIEEARKETNKDIVNRIVLVGGFGDSEYLRKALREYYEPKGITITVPDRPQAAIVQGAALRGLEGLHSTTKRFRRSYGFVWSAPFREGIDDEAESYIDDLAGKKMAWDYMEWMVVKGEKYTESYTQSTEIQWTYYASMGLRHDTELYACDLSDTPEKLNSDVYLVGNIILNLSGVDLNRFETKYIKGELAYRIFYELSVTFGSKDGL